MADGAHQFLAALVFRDVTASAGAQDTVGMK
jgi:hypothetical protein